MKKIILAFAILFAAGLNGSRAQDTWIQKADFAGTPRWGAVGFSIGSKGYIGTGADANAYKKDFWEYDATTNVWTQKADFGGTARYDAVGFSIGSKGYIGTGTVENDFWEYDPTTNAWTQKANFGGPARNGAVGFSIGNKGYIGTGFYHNSTHYNDFWEYDPATNGWTQKANFGGSARFWATGFSIGNKGYIGFGVSHKRKRPNKMPKDFWEYDPSTNVWTQKANVWTLKNNPDGTGSHTAFGFSIGSKGYISTGFLTSDFAEYDPITNAWTRKANFGGTGRQGAVGFSIGSKGYIGTGNHFGLLSDFWEYTPDTSSCAIPSNLLVTNITSSSAKLNWDAVAGAAGYAVRYKVTGTNPWTLKYSTGNAKNLNNLSPNTSYDWEAKTYCTINPGLSSAWSAKQKFTTGTLRMGDESVQQVSFQIYPNPAEDHATIQFTLPQSSHVFVKVFDVGGKEIATLLDADLERGEHSFAINTQRFSKGVYMVRMISDFGIENQKLIVQ